MPKQQLDRQARGKNILPRTMAGIFALGAAVSILALGLILIFLLYRGVPIIAKTGISDFIFGQVWKPTAGEFGIFPMIVASFLATVGAAVLGGVIGLFTAVFMVELLPQKFAKFFRIVIDLLAGIPSVVYGFFGLMVVVPWIYNRFGGTGNSLLAVILILAVMILPTMVSITENALRAVPRQYKEGSLALGATQMETVFKVTIPTAKSGILAAFILSIGRAVGETMAVILICGNRAMLPHSIFDPVRPMTANIALEMGYAAGAHQEALYGTGVVLLVFIIIINFFASYMIKRGGKQRG